MFFSVIIIIIFVTIIITIKILHLNDIIPYLNHWYILVYPSSSFPYTMDIFYAYCNPQWNSIFFNFLHLIICWLLWFKVFVLFTSVCQNSHWPINMPLGSHKAILCGLNTYYKLSTCFPVSTYVIFSAVGRMSLAQWNHSFLGFQFSGTTFLVYHTLSYFLTLVYHACT